MNNYFLPTVSIIVMCCFVARAQDNESSFRQPDSSEEVHGEAGNESGVENTGYADDSGLDKNEEQAPPAEKKSEQEESTESPLVIKPEIAKYNYDAMPKDPVASTLFSVTFPGAGQMYNKEYLRGILTGVAFWGSFFVIQYEIYRWEQYNTDTLYFREYDRFGEPLNKYREVRVPKDEDDQVGLPTAEKVVLVSALAVAGSSYFFGIIDSYKGAGRYNDKLFGLSRNIRERKLNFSLAMSRRYIGLQTNIRW